MRNRFFIEVLPLFVFLLIPVSVQADMFARFASLFANPDRYTEETIQYFGDALTVPLLTTAQNPNAAGIGGGDISYYEGFIKSTGPVGPEVIAAAQENRGGEISVYVVRDGDSLSQIAEMYGVTANTILWANDIARANQIKPGQTLIILPVAGVQHTVAVGESLSSLAKKYDADLNDIIEYNRLADATEIAVGDSLIIPGGIVPAPPRPAVRPTPTNADGAPTVSSSGSFLAHPLPGSVRSQGLHGYNAVDFSASPGTSIRAAAAGEVMVARSGGWNGGYGNYVVIRHGNGVQTLYAHLSSVAVSAGEYVGQGQVIGGVGNTGRSTGPHLHFEVRGGSNPF